MLLTSFAQNLRENNERVFKKLRTGKNYLYILRKEEKATNRISCGNLSEIETGAYTVLIFKQSCGSRVYHHLQGPCYYERGGGDWEGVGMQNSNAWSIQGLFSKRKAQSFQFQTFYGVQRRELYYRGYMEYVNIVCVCHIRLMV